MRVGRAYVSGPERNRLRRYVVLQAHYENGPMTTLSSSRAVKIRYVEIGRHFTFGRAVAHARALNRKSRNKP